jgi:peptidoglycan/xylan/chitin deacetylase (PgdA/CDA1 family)
MWTGVFDFLSPPGARARLSVLIYHRVLNQPDPFRPSDPNAAAFEERMRLLQRWFRMLPLAEAVHRLMNQSLPARAMAVTFDDGYADNFTVALPILQRLGIPATFFISTGFLDGGRMWNDGVIEAVRNHPGPMLDLSGEGLGSFTLHNLDAKRAAVGALLSKLKYLPRERREAIAGKIADASGGALPQQLMMTSAQVLALRAAGMEIGAHTVSHPILARIGFAEARNEMASGKRRLEEILGERVDLFAYPNGKPVTDYGPEHVSLARECGFRAAFSTARGAASTASDLYQIPRFTPWDRNGWKAAARLAQTLLQSEFEVAEGRERRVA